jgi:anti-anti-sigma factor
VDHAGKAAPGSGKGALMMELLKIAVLESRRGLKLSGEIDISNVKFFADSLHSHLKESEDIYLDLSDLKFIDAAGIRVLAQAAKQLSNGKRLILWSAPTFFKRLLFLLKLDESQGLRLAG